MPKQAFLDTLRQHPDLAESFLEKLARRLHESTLLLALRSIRSAPKRLLYYLQLNLQADGFTVFLDHSLKAIADDLGLTPETPPPTPKQLYKEVVSLTQR